MKIRVDTHMAVAPRYCRGPHCKKKSKLIIRHHMGNDRFLGIFDTKIAKQYYEYNNCVYLCDDCHLEIHWLYIRDVIRTTRWTDDLQFRPQQARLYFISYCERWLAGKVKRPRSIDPDYRKMWRRNIAEWLKSRSR